MKASYSDDNKQFNYFVNFLDKYRKSVKHIPINIKERIWFKVTDKNSKVIPNATVTIYDILNKNFKLSSGKTSSDGSYLFFPSELNDKIFNYKAVFRYGKYKKAIRFSRQDKRKMEIKLDIHRKLPEQIPLDILFVLDTTGSMGEEIKRLKATIELIHLNLNSLSIKPKVRFGMVLYKDKTDEYRTKTIPLTSDLDSFQAALDKVSAAGGGDLPEDLQEALRVSMKEIKWNKNGIRLSFIITDAPAQLDYGQKYTYISAAQEAKARGIKLYTVGVGGLNLSGEYMLRQIAQYSYAKYIFLTYGEKTESDGGKVGSVSHHTGSNFISDKLEAVIINFAREELNNLLDKPAVVYGSFFQADKIESEKSDETLGKLFSKAVNQLSDFSSLQIIENTTTAIVGLVYENFEDNQLKKDTEYFTAFLTQAVSKNKLFRLVDRKDMNKILSEIELNQEGLLEPKSSIKTGKLIGAKLFIGGSVFKRKSFYEVFLKLVKMETSEVLSVTKAKISLNLGLSKFIEDVDFVNK